MSSQITPIDQVSGSLFGAKVIRRFLAAMCLLAMVSLWYVAAAPSPNKILGLYSTRIFLGLLITSYLLGWATYILLSFEPASGKLASLMLTTVTMIIIVGLFEMPAAFGWIDYRNVISPPESYLVTRLKPWDNPANLFDPELMHIHRPNQHFEGETKGDLVSWLGISTSRRYQVNLTWDKNGFRNSHEIDEAPVVMLGDSFVEGVLVPENELVSAELSRQLGTEVANLGQSGYGPQQELVVLRRFGSKLQPRVVLWFFFEGNDLLDVSRYEEFVQNRDEIVAAQNSFARRSFVRNFLFTLSGLTAPTPGKDKSEARLRSGTFTGKDNQPETLYFAYAAAQLSERELESLKTAKASILEAQRIAKAQDAQLLLVYVPTKFRVYSEFCKFAEDGYGRNWKVNDLPDQIAAWSKEKDIPYLNLTAALRQQAALGELVYFIDDGHWNSRGHQVVATAVADFIKSGRWLASTTQAAK